MEKHEYFLIRILNKTNNSVKLNYTFFLINGGITYDKRVFIFSTKQ